MLNFPIASSAPFIAPGSALFCGAFETSGLGGGVGVIGIRNAATTPTSNPSSGGILYVDNGALTYRDPNGTVSRVAGTARTVTANYTVLATDDSVLSNGTGITITLPSAATVGTGRRHRIKNIHSSASVTVNSTAGNIDGGTTTTLTPKSALEFLSDGTNWWIF
jgi:hypothetical protein